MSYNSYNLRLGITDDGFYNRALEENRGKFDRNIKNSPNYKEVLLNGLTAVDAIVTEYSYTLSNLDKKKMSTSFNSDVNLGDYVFFGGSNWLISTAPNYTVDSYKENIIERCNLNPLMYKIGNTVYSNYGLYEDKNYVNQFGKTVNVPKDNIEVKIPLNINSKKIRLNDLFYIFEDDWYQAYRVASLNRSYQDGEYGILGIRAEITDVSESPQSYYNLEPTSVTISKVLVSPENISPSKGNVVTLEVFVYDGSGSVIPSPAVTWSTSDANIATVDTSGNVTSVNTGTCNIFATSNIDDSVYGKCEINVVDGGAWF